MQVGCRDFHPLPVQKTNMQVTPIFRRTDPHQAPSHSVRGPSTSDEVIQVRDGDAGSIVRGLEVLVCKDSLKLFRVRGRSGFWQGLRLARIVEMDATAPGEPCYHQDRQEQTPFLP